MKIIYTKNKLICGFYFQFIFVTNIHMWYLYLGFLVWNVKPKCETKYEINHWINKPTFVPKCGFPYLLQLHLYVIPKYDGNVRICDIRTQFIFVINVYLCVTQIWCFGTYMWNRYVERNVKFDSTKYVFFVTKCGTQMWNPNVIFSGGIGDPYLVSFFANLDPVPNVRCNEKIPLLMKN